MGSRSPLKRKHKITLAAAVIVGVLGIIGVTLAAVINRSAGNRDVPSATSSTTENNAGCSIDRSTIQGDGNKFCVTTNVSPPSNQSGKLQGGSLDGDCTPPDRAEAASRTAVEIRVRYWCSQRLLGTLAKRKAQQAKLKVVVRNDSGTQLRVNRERWVLLVKGSQARDRWRGAPGANWRRPRTIEFEGNRVTAIAANPDGAAEDQSGDYGPTFATRFRKSTVAPGTTWRPRRLSGADPQRNGVLVFYLPYTGKRADRDPSVLALALLGDDEKVAAYCSLSKWGGETSAETF